MIFREDGLIRQIFGKKIFNTSYEIRGSPEFRRKIHHELMKRAEITEERNTGTVFIMPGKRLAVSLGKSKEKDQYGWFSLEIDKLACFLGYKRLDSCESIFGRDVYYNLMVNRVSRLVRDDGIRSNLFNSHQINPEDINDPKKVYIRTCTITAARCIDTSPPLIFSNISYNYEEG